MVVGSGASAGSLNSCRGLLEVMPPNSGMASVIGVHLDPKRESLVAQSIEQASDLLAADRRWRAAAFRQGIGVAMSNRQTNGDTALRKPALTTSRSVALPNTSALWNCPCCWRSPL